MWPLKHLVQQLTLRDWVAVVGLVAGGALLLGSGWGLAQMTSRDVLQDRAQLEPAVQIQPTPLIQPEQEILVEVTGAVNQPGVYQLHPGARVIEALQAAGGLSSVADPTYVHQHLRLAEVVTDEAKITIPFISTSQSSDQSASKQIPPEGSTSINRSSQAQLEELPGIGSSRAAKIVENRPYSEIEELVSRKIIPQAVLDDIKEMISL